MQKTAEIRQSFLDFFKAKGHSIVPSAPLLPSSPNLLFTNAGMNQFVPYFLAERKSPSSRIADTQKCIRAGGKHNDLEDVGLDTYHHTLFEMLGNWSFGDYFKEEAINWAWELLTQVWKFPKERLYATIYKPGRDDPAGEDTEARELWNTIFTAEGLDPEVHVLTGGSKDNFWMMGETGPCGPCSELHMDLTPNGDTQGKLVNKDSHECIEIWNLVFIQFNAQPDGSFAPLGQNHVDTGMGLERVAGILSNTENFTRFDKTPSNYEGDLFQEIFETIGTLCNHRYGGTLPLDTSNLSIEESRDCAFRVLADHVRTLAFSIADGILPGNEGRNYVLRRILRRALMYARKLDLPDGSFSKLAPTVVKTMGDAFPELVNQQDIIRKVLEAEENSFEKTLQRGLQFLEKLAGESQEEISGEDAFLLYDTYGFPLDLTQLIAREKGLSVDEDGFQSAMEQQRQRGRASRKTEVISVSRETGEHKATLFAGFSRDNLVNFDATISEAITNERGIFLILDQSPFYAEMGGQIGDTGTIETQGNTFHVTNTILDASGRHLHEVEDALPGNLEGQRVRCSVNTCRRQGIQCHHTATHLLHWGLRETLGTHVRQAGSLVEEGRLRFDFSHFEPVSDNTLRTIEEKINSRILQHAAVETLEIAFDDKPDDVISFFGEKYGERVRVVDIGGYSKELCGGCHVLNTAELGLFKIISETGIAAGTRRVEAIAANPAHQLANSALRTLGNLAHRLNCTQEEVEKRLDNLLLESREMDKQIKEHRQQEMAQQADDLGGQLQEVNGLKCLIYSMNNSNPKEIQSLAVSTFKKIGADVLLMGGATNGKVFLNALCSGKAIAEGYNAGEIVRNVLQEIGGNGGGKPDFATGGGKDNGEFGNILEALQAQPVGLKS